jgi:hypothetical protein
MGFPIEKSKEEGRSLVSEKYQYCKNGAVSNQLTDVGSGGVCDCVLGVRNL